MTIAKWSDAFSDATKPRSLTSPMSIGREFRAFGSNLALMTPTELFNSHEWLRRTHLRPQTHVHAWLGAVAVFGPLFHQYEALCSEVVNAMHSSEDADTGGLDEDEDELLEDADVSAANIVDHTPAPVPPRKQRGKARETDDSSAATAPAGVATLLQQRIAGKDRQHQLRYDIKLLVPASKEADKTMIAAAKKFYAKAKEMDDYIVIYPWF
jgi:hypothetical protein